MRREGVRSVSSPEPVSGGNITETGSINYVLRRVVGRADGERVLPGLAPPRDVYREALPRNRAVTPLNRSAESAAISR